MAFDFTNLSNLYDVNDDTQFDISDLREVYFDLAANGPRTLDIASEAPTRYVDVNGDSALTLQDLRWVFRGLLEAPAESEEIFAEATLTAPWSAAEPGEEVTAQLVVKTFQPLVQLDVTIEGSGVFDAVSEAIRFNGPWAGPTELVREIQIPAGLGEGQLQIRLQDPGNEARAESELVYVVIESDRHFTSQRSTLYAHLDQITEDFEAGEFPVETRDAMVADLLRASSVSTVTMEEAEGENVTIDVNGVVQWTDSAGVAHPLPSATVEIRDDDLIGSNLITTVTTDSSGRYAASFTHDDGLGQGDPDIFVRVLARSSVADIAPDSLLGSTYFMDSAVQDEVADASMLTINLTAGTPGSTPTQDADTAFSIHHALVLGGQYTGGLAGSTPSQIDVLFPSTGSFFNGSELHLLQIDRWDWDVILHEYGHYVQDVHNFENNPGGPHSSRQNLAAQRGSKDIGVHLAWGEGWPTYFGIAAQQRTGAASLGIPNVGDPIYQDTEEASPFSNNLETNGGLGEDNEASVMAVLWDLFDNASDGVDEISISDRALFQSFKSAGAVTVGAAWDALAAGEDAEQRARLGDVFAQNNISPELTAPADHFAASGTPPTFRWLANGGGAPNPLNDFRIRFYTSDFSSLVFEKELGNTTSFTPTGDEWTMILEGDEVVRWVVEGRNTSAPATPGGTLDYYSSGSRSINGISIVFVIDDTGSMGEEIASVRSALQTYIDTVAAGLPADTEPPIMQLITFKDNVTTRLTTNDLDQMRAAVAALTASGGGDCPEFSAHALARAADNVSPGGTVLLATDAAPQPGVDMGAVLARLQSNGVTVNTILSGDCEGIESEGEAAADFAQGDPAPPPEGESNKPGEDDDVTNDPPQNNIDGDPGAMPPDLFADSLDTPATLALGTEIRGLIDDDVDVFGVEIVEPGSYRFATLVEDGAAVSLELFDADGTLIAARTGFEIDFQMSLPNAAHKVRISSASQSTYLLKVEADEINSLTSAVDVFSTVSSLTGGAFFVLDNVNTGSSDRYEAAVINVLSSTFGPSVLQSTPSTAPQSQSLLLTLTGANTNWREGEVTVTFPGDGVNVLNVEVESAIRLNVEISVDDDAALGDRDVSVVSDVGGTEETAVGLSVLEIVPAPTSATLLGVTPSNLVAGETFELLVQGALTTWDEATTVSLGPGINVSVAEVLSPTRIAITADVSNDASLGLRTLRVNDPGDGETSLSRAAFVFSDGASIPAIIDVTPDTGAAGEELVVQLNTVNTTLIEGLTTANFGSGITVKSIDVLDESTADVMIEIDADAASGFRNVQLTTSDEVAVLLKGFFVEGEPATPVRDVFVAADPSDATRNALFINGDDKSEVIRVLPFGNGAYVYINHEAWGHFDFDGGIYVESRDGRDVFWINPWRFDRSVNVDAGRGNDRIFGGGGPNVLIGGPGNDILHGFDGNDVLIGGDGNDWLLSRGGNDILLGGDGRDYLFAGLGDDHAEGGSGNDWLRSIGGQNELFGDDGNDILLGGINDDLLVGGAGVDFLFAGLGNNLEFQDEVLP